MVSLCYETYQLMTRCWILMQMIFATYRSQPIGLSWNETNTLKNVFEVWLCRPFCLFSVFNNIMCCSSPQAASVVSVTDSLATWYLRVISATVTACLPLLPQLQNIILQHSRLQQQHICCIPNLCLTSVVNNDDDDDSVDNDCDDRLRLRFQIKYHLQRAKLFISTEVLLYMC